MGNVTNYLPVNSTQDIQMNFIRVPEIALMNCTNASITHDLGIMLMQPILQSDLGVKDEKSFLSPVNYFDFE